MKKTIYLVRHAQTLFNERKKIQGWCDSPVTVKGYKQAEATGKYFKNNNIVFDKVYCSTSERTSDTVERITNLPYTRLKGLKEVSFGLFEGESEALNPKYPYGDFFKQYGGESVEEAQLRFDSTMNKIVEDEASTILVVAHTGVMVMFYMKWIEYAKAEITEKLGNCSIFKYEYEDNKFSLVEIITEHLASI